MSPIDRQERICNSGATVSKLRTEATDLQVRGRRVWRLLEDFSVCVPFNCGVFECSVPAGFETDFASTPRFLWWLFPHDEVAEAAVIHDWLYDATDLSRFFCDAVFRLVMILTDKSYFMRVGHYLGVRAGGWFFRGPSKKVGV